MASITVKQKEAKTVQFTVTNSSGAAVDLTGASLKFYVEDSTETLIIQKEDIDFDKTGEASGIVTVPLSATDLDQTEDSYKGELGITFSGSNIDKSIDIEVNIQKAVIP